MFRSPGLAAVVRWSKGVHLRVFLVCVLTVVATVCALGMTMATKGLVDGAVSSNMSSLRRFAILLMVIILLQHALSALRAMLRIGASADLQKHLQGMLVSIVQIREAVILGDSSSLK